jgi:hypothetical protein
MRFMTWVLVVIVGLSILTACKPEDPKVPPKKATPAAAAPRANPNPNPDSKADPQPGQQPPPPPADPGPYNDIHEVVVKVWWIGEQSGTVRTLVNNAERFVESAGRTSKGEDNRYHGGYTKVVPGLNKGDEIDVEWRGAGHPDWVMMVIYHNARIAADTQSGQPNCLKIGKICAVSAVITL